MEIGKGYNMYPGLVKFRQKMGELSVHVGEKIVATSC